MKHKLLLQYVITCTSMYYLQVLGRRVSGLSEGLENAAVQCSRQREMVQSMKKELKETQEFIEVRISYTNMLSTDRIFCVTW